MSVQEKNEELMEFLCDTIDTALSCGIEPSPMLRRDAINAYMNKDMVILDPPN